LKQKSVILLYDAEETGIQSFSFRGGCERVFATGNKEVKKQKPNNGDT